MIWTPRSRSRNLHPEVRVFLEFRTKGLPKSSNNVPYAPSFILYLP